MGNIPAVKAKVQQYLTSIFGTATIDSDGDFTVRRDSSRAFIRVTGDPDPDAPTFLIIFAPVLRNATNSPELHRWIAYQSNLAFGHFELHDRSDGSVDLVLSHTLLGDYLDEPELGYALTYIARRADELDEDLQAKFGGTRFHEE
jgi:hypothetical protein